MVSNLDCISISTNKIRFSSLCNCKTFLFMLFKSTQALRCTLKLCHKSIKFFICILNVFKLHIWTKDSMIIFYCKKIRHINIFFLHKRRYLFILWIIKVTKLIFRWDASADGLLTTFEMENDIIESSWWSSAHDAAQLVTQHSSWCNIDSDAAQLVIQHSSWCSTARDATQLETQHSSWRSTATDAAQLVILNVIHRF